MKGKGSAWNFFQIPHISNNQTSSKLLSTRQYIMIDWVDEWTCEVWTGFVNNQQAVCWAV